MRVVLQLLLVVFVAGPSFGDGPGLARSWEYLDDLLGRPYSDGTPLRTAGPCLWATHPRGWGFPNDVHYIHLSRSEPFFIELSHEGVSIVPGEAWAHVSHVETLGVTSGDDAARPLPPPLRVVEMKYIGPDDVLVSVIEACNEGGVDTLLRVVVRSGMLAPDGDGLAAARTISGVPLELYLGMNSAVSEGGGLRRDVIVPARGCSRLRIGMAFARSAMLARGLVEGLLATADPVAEQARRYGSWFVDTVPQLDVPDPWFEKLWAFRWELVRRNLMDPRWGRLQHPTFAEGRWSAGWFATPITFGAPLQLRELRWLRDPSWARGHVLSFVDNQRADGAFVGFTVDEPRREYTDWLAAAVWEVFLVTGDTDLLRRALPAMERNLEYVRSRDGDGDHLPVVEDHFATGMEWQPAFFYFNDYHTDASTPLERVDYAAVWWANARAVAHAAEALCGSGAEAESLAAAVASSVVERMWDEDTGFYYSLREADDALAEVREIAGFYPLAFGLAPPEHYSRATALLFDPTEFWTPWAPASSSLTCPATSQDGWPVGPGGLVAMWNGPTWPHAISLAVDATARALREGDGGHVTKEQLFELIERATKAQFFGLDEARDFDEPFVGEFYHGERGLWKTPERDYFHSTWADMLIRHLVGLMPLEAERVRLDPLLPPGTWDYFLLERVPLRGHELTVLWDQPDGADHYEDGREGLELWIDGRLAATRPDLGLLEAPLTTTTLLATKDPTTGHPILSTTQNQSPWTLYRTTSRDQTGLHPLPASPFTGPATDENPPPAPLTLYTAGACGPGF